MFFTFLGFNIVTANSISILHIAFGVSSENATHLFAIYFFEQYIWLLPIVFYKNKVFSAASLIVYLADIVCMFICCSNGASEKFQHLFECSGVIWQISLIFDVLLIALLAYRIIALPAHIFGEEKKIFGLFVGYNVAKQRKRNRFSKYENRYITLTYTVSRCFYSLILV